MAWFKEHKVLLRFLLSYLVVLVLPIAIISSVIQGRLLAELETEVRRSNQMLLRQVSQVMDLRIRELALLAGQMSLNPRVRNFLFRPGSGPEEVIRTIDLQKDMAIYQAPNRFLADLYVYSYKADAMISQKARYSPSFLYQRVYRPAGMAYGDWLAGMHGDYASGKLNASTYLVFDTGVSTPQKLITYMQSLPANEGYASGMLIAYLANEQIEQLFAPLVSGERGTAFIADKEGRVLISTGRTAPTFWPVGKDMGRARYTLDGEPAIASVEKSGITDWYYVALVPARIFNAKVFAIRALMLVILILCLLIGVGIAAGLSWRNYRPVKTMLAVLAPLKVGSRGAPKDEIALIVESTKEAVRENQSLRSYLQQNEALVQSNLLRRVLYGRIPLNEIGDILRILGASADASYLVAVVDIEMPPDQSTAAAKGMMTLAATEGIQRLIPCLVAEIEDERLGVLIARPADWNGKEASLEIAGRIQDHLSAEYHIPVSIGLSAAAGAEDIPRTFREAAQAADYRIVKGHYVITTYDQIAQVDNCYYYPLDRERQLINHVKAADYAAVSSAVDEVYEENFVRRQLPISLVRCVFFDLIGTALKVLNEFNASTQEVLGFDAEADHWLTQPATAAEMRDKLKQVYDRICRWIGDHRQEGENSKLREEIISQLDRIYVDPNLSLVMLAERLGVSLSYLSRFIKDQIGYNFTEYLNRLRVERAKELLGDERRTIGEVASAVGYLSANTFIRIFKKYEGVTPGQFRSRFSARPSRSSII